MKYYAHLALSLPTYLKKLVELWTLVDSLGRYLERELVAFCRVRVRGARFVQMIRGSH